MFRKPFKEKPRENANNSARKKLLSRLCEIYPSEDDTKLRLESVLCKDVTRIQLIKLRTSRGTDVVVYMCQVSQRSAMIPICFEFDRALYPTVYLLWLVPIRPLFIIYPEVFAKLRCGAKLFLPGVVVQEDSEQPLHELGKFSKGQVAAVALEGNPFPVAVGKTAMSGAEMASAKMKGCAVVILHTYKDLLWELGDRRELSFTNSQPFVAQPDAMASTQEVPCAQVEPVESESDQESVDTHLRNCFLYALKFGICDADLPMKYSYFFRQHIYPHCPKSDIWSSSSYSKPSDFVRDMTKQGFVKTETTPEGVSTIVKIDRRHRSLLHFRAADWPSSTVIEELKKVELEQAHSSGISYSPPSIVTMYRVTKTVLPVMSGHLKGDPLTAQQVKTLLRKYVSENKLHDHANMSLVHVDDVLRRVVSSDDEVCWNCLFENCFCQMTMIQRMSFPDGSPSVTVLGRVPPIRLFIPHNKWVTVVFNLDKYGIDMDELKKLIGKSRGCWPTVCKREDIIKHGKPRMCLKVRGNQIGYIGKLLIEKYRIPHTWIEGLEYARKETKKKSGIVKK